jgi:tetratricopeptide (TPR) repeat protein
MKPLRLFHSLPLVAMLLLAPRTALPQPQAPSAADIWKNPAFQKQLLGSYAINTEIEPLLNETEQAVHDKVVPLIGSNPEGVIGAIEKLVTPESSARFELILANIHAQQGRVAKAVEWYQKAVAKFPAYRTAWNNLGVQLVKLERHPEALAAFTRAIELGASSGTMFGLLGFSSMQTGQLVSAESAYRMAVLLDPASVDWKLGLGSALLRQEKFADAAALFGQLVAASPDKVEYWLLQASAFIGLKRPLDAAGNFEVVRRLGAATGETLATLGDIYVNEGLFELASQAYGEAFKAAPDKGLPGLLRAAEILTARSALDEARALLALATEGASAGKKERKQILKLRSRIALAERKDAEAAQVLDEVVREDPLDGESLILLGQYHARSGQTEKAVFLFERAEGIPDFEADAKVRHAQLLVQGGNYAGALPLLRRAQDIKPRDSVGKFIDELERHIKTRK